MKKDDLEHAAHNEGAFKHLLQKPEYTDWIITTAFYSALHYVDSKIFPIKGSENGIHFQVDNMDSYAVSALNKFSNDKHVCRLKLVERNLREISVEFSWLHNRCTTARYHNYKFDNAQELCDKSAAYLAKIKEHVTKKNSDPKQNK